MANCSSSRPLMTMMGTCGARACTRENVSGIGLSGRDKSSNTRSIPPRVSFSRPSLSVAQWSSSKAAPAESDRYSRMRRASPGLSSMRRTLSFALETAAFTRGQVECGYLQGIFNSELGVGTPNGHEQTHAAQPQPKDVASNDGFVRPQRTLRDTEFKGSQPH